MASDADFTSGRASNAPGWRERLPNRGQLNELARMLNTKPAALPTQFPRSTNSEALVLMEVETAASHLLRWSLPQPTPTRRLKLRR
jgi:hypothetical protein